MGDVKIYLFNKRFPHSQNANPAVTHYNTLVLHTPAGFHSPSVVGSVGERHPADERLSGVWSMGGGEGGEGGVWAVSGMCGESGERGDGGVSGVRTEGQRGGVDVVVVHDWTGQHQLKQTANNAKTE